MTRRMLNEIELKIANKNLTTLKEELELEEAMLKRKTVNIDTAEAIYHKQLREMIKEQKAGQEVVDTITSTIKTLTDQIENGVEAKSNNDKDKRD